MKIKSKWIALALSAVLIVGTLAGCSNDAKETTKSPETNAPGTTSEQETPEPSEESTEKTGYVVPEEPVTIRIYHMGTEPEGCRVVNDVQL